MKLKKYLKENKIKKNISILMLDDNDEVIPPIEFKPCDFKNINKELLNREYMESVDEEDCIEVWVM